MKKGKNKTLIFAGVFVFVLLLLSFASANIFFDLLGKFTGKVIDAQNQENILDSIVGQFISGEGTIHSVDFEGGCWQIVGKNGVNYEPLNLNESYKKEGLELTFEGNVIKNFGNTCQVGKLINLTKIESLGKFCQNFPHTNFCPSGVKNIIIIGVDKNGCAIYSCLKQNETQNNWSQDFLVDNLSPNSLTPNIMADKKGDIHLIWGGYPFRIFYRELDGQGWSNILNLTSNNTYSRNPRAAIDENGIIHLVFSQNTAAEKFNTNYSLYYTQIDSNTRESIKEPVKININFPLNFEPFNDILIDDSGNINLIGAFYLRIDENGKVLEYNQEITGQTISKDKEGNIYVPYLSRSSILINKFNGVIWSKQLLFEENIFTSGYGDMFIFSHESKTFVLHSSTDQNLQERGLYVTEFNDLGVINSEKILANTHQIDEPRILINDDGKAVILFNEYVDEGCDANTEIFYIISKEFDSMQWGDVQRKTFAPGFSSIPKTTPDLKNNWHIVWKDNRNDPDINLCNTLGQINPQIYYSEFVNLLESPENKTLCAAPICDGRLDTGKVDSNGCKIYSCPVVTCIEPICEKGLTLYDTGKVDSNGCEVYDCSGTKIACESGCLLDNQCYFYGYRKSEQYCSDAESSFVLQKNQDASCQNSFECGSNLCIDNKCIDQRVFQKILDWFSNLFE